jgi:hypothetical protein
MEVIQMPDTPNTPDSKVDPTADQPFARSGSGSIILDTPDQIELFHLLQMKYALKIEIRTGMRHSQGSILKLVNDTLLKNDFIERPLHRKALALEALDRYIETKTKALTDDPT